MGSRRNNLERIKQDAREGVQAGIDPRVVAAREQYEVDMAKEWQKRYEQREEIIRRVDGGDSGMHNPPPFAPTGPAYGAWVGKRNRRMEEVKAEMGIEAEQELVEPDKEIGEIILKDWALAKQMLSQSLSETTKALIWRNHYLYADEYQDTNEVIQAFSSSPGVPESIYLHILQAYPEKPELAQAIAQHPDLTPRIRQFCDQVTRDK